MSVPQNISQLNTTPTFNSPAGTEPIGNNLSSYLQTAFAFIAQLANGAGLAIAQALNMNSNQINNVANGTANTDAINLGQLKAYLPVGNIQMYSGAVANIASAWGADWVLCDGTNGTPDLRGKFVVGAGGTYAPGASGGSTSVTLSTANLPVHSHGVNDGGHVHGVNDGGHAHSGTTVNAGNHQHVSPWGENNGSYSPPWGSYGANNLIGAQNHDYDNCWGLTSPAGDHTHTFTTNGSGTGISIQGAGAGISIQNTGSGQAFTVIPPYYALCFVMKISSN